MKEIEDKYSHYCNIDSDINQHMPVLYKYAKMSEVIVEMGVRDVVSTWAFLNASPKKIIGIDINKSNNIDEVYELSSKNNINFEFIQGSSLEISIPKTNLLFIDTFHNYNQLKKELNMHHKNVLNWIIMHDTTLFAHHSEASCVSNSLNDHGDISKGLWDAIEEFLQKNKNWKLKERFENNNGLTILERI